MGEWIKLTKDTTVENIVKKGKFYWVRIKSGHNVFNEVDACLDEGELYSIDDVDDITHIMELDEPAPPKSDEEILISNLKEILNNTIYKLDELDKRNVINTLKELSIEL